MEENQIPNTIEQSIPTQPPPPVVKSPSPFHNKKLLLIAACIVVFLILIPSAMSLQKSSQPKTSSPTPTIKKVVSPTLLPTKVATPSPSITTVMPKVQLSPTLTPTPSISPTPGEMGFKLSKENPDGSIAKGTCAPVTTLTSTGSTKFHLRQFGYNIWKWEQTEGTLGNGASMDLKICVPQDSTGSGTGGMETVLYDDTTGATKTFMVYIRIP